MKAEYEAGLLFATLFRDLIQNKLLSMAVENMNFDKLNPGLKNKLVFGLKSNLHTESVSKQNWTRAAVDYSRSQYQTTIVVRRFLNEKHAEFR